MLTLLCACILVCFAAGMPQKSHIDSVRHIVYNVFRRYEIIMKCRRYIAAAAVAVLSLGIAVGAAGCSGGSTAAKGVRSEEVTKEQWDTAIAEFGTGEAYENFKAEISICVHGRRYTDGVFVELKFYTDIVMVVADGKQYYSESTWQKGKYGKIGLDHVYATDEYYSVANTDGTYTKYTLNAADEWSTSTAYSGVVSYSQVTNYLSDKNYDSYVFSGDRGGYVEYNDRDETGVVVKFKDGKLAAIWGDDQEFDGISSGAVVETTLSIVITYGKQKVELPELN